MITVQTQKAYTEILQILEYIPKEYVNRIPKPIIEIFKKEKLNNYSIKINKENPIDKNTLQKETIEIIAMLNYQYWCEDEELKNKLYEQYSKNEEKYKNEIDVSNIFRKRKNTINENTEEMNKNMALVQYKENIFSRIINKIKEWLKR